MGKMVGYMVTWTTYGSWLQGDKRGYVRDGKIFPADAGLEEVNKKESSKRQWSKRQKRIGQKILALAVCSNHIHLVAGKGNESIENSVSRYKNVSSSALKKAGLTKRIWTRGFDKRFCFNNEHLEQKIKYVRHHDKTG